MLFRTKSLQNFPSKKNWNKAGRNPTQWDETWQQRIGIFSPSSFHSFSPPRETPCWHSPLNNNQASYTVILKQCQVNSGAQSPEMQTAGSRSTIKISPQETNFQIWEILSEITLCSCWHTTVDWKPDGARRAKFWHLRFGLCIRSINLLTELLQKRPHISITRGHVPEDYIYIYIYIYISSSPVICQTTGPKPLAKRFLHIVRSRAYSFNSQYPLLFLRSSSSFLRLLPCLLVTSICPFIFAFNNLF